MPRLTVTTEIARHVTTLERVHEPALELYLPASRRAQGVGELQQAFGALLMGRPRYPHTALSSTVWMEGT